MHKMWLQSTDCMIPVVFFSLFSWKKLFEQISEFFFFFQGKFSETDVSWTPQLERALNYDRDAAQRKDNGVFSFV